jgi:hypothetical protein
LKLLEYHDILNEHLFSSRRIPSRASWSCNHLKVYLAWARRQGL